MIVPIPKVKNLNFSIENDDEILNSKSPENYRPITILSCFGKLFTSKLYARLIKFLDAHTILEENQAGVSTGYSTMAHIFVLHA